MLFQVRTVALPRRMSASKALSSFSTRCSSAAAGRNCLLSGYPQTRKQHAWFTTIKRDPGLALTCVISDPKEVQGPAKDIPSRAQQIRGLEGANQDFDILVIGGGATGAGIALDAATRGLSVACIERGDFSSETSSRSTKLIWAGLKYMATASAALLSPNLFTSPMATVTDFLGEMHMVLECHNGAC